MLAVDILEVPLSPNNNRYLLAVQDHFTRWADAIPLPDQTTKRISSELVKLLSIYGLPQVLHSDQGRNFESALLAQTLQAIGISKSHTSAYHPQGDGLVERLNRSLLQMLRTYVKCPEEREQFLLLPPVLLVLIALLSTIPQACVRSHSCMDATPPSHRSLQLQLLTPRHTQLIFKPNWLRCTTSLKQTSQQQLTVKSQFTTSTPQNPISQLGI